MYNICVPPKSKQTQNIIIMSAPPKLSLNNKAKTVSTIQVIIAIAMFAQRMLELCRHKKTKLTIAEAGNAIKVHVGTSMFCKSEIVIMLKMPIKIKLYW